MTKKKKRSNLKQRKIKIKNRNPNSNLKVKTKSRKSRQRKRSKRGTGIKRPPIKNAIKFSLKTPQQRKRMEGFPSLSFLIGKEYLYNKKNSKEGEETTADEKLTEDGRLKEVERLKREEAEKRAEEERFKIEEDKRMEGERIKLEEEENRKDEEERLKRDAEEKAEEERKTREADEAKRAEEERIKDIGKSKHNKSKKYFTNKPLAEGHAPPMTKEIESETMKELTIEEFYGIYQELEIIAEGSYGKVYKGLDQATNTLIAIKRIELDFDSTELDLRREIHFLRKVSHLKNCVSLIEAYNIKSETEKNEDTPYYLIMQLITLPDLDIISKALTFTPQELWFTSVCMVSVFRHLRTLKIMHLDFKLNNCILDRDGYVVLCDFGISEYYTGDNRGECSTPEYKAPEFQMKKNITYAADYFAFGLSLLKMITKENYFVSGKQWRQQIMNRRIEVPKDLNDKNLVDFIKRCTEPDFSVRIGYADIRELMNHRYLENVDFSSVDERTIASPFVNRLKEISEIPKN